MRILFISDNFWPEVNAPATRLHEHARIWVEAGHHVTVITSAPNFPEGRVYAGYRNAWRAVEDVEGIRVVRVKTYIAANEGFVRRTLDYLSFMVSALLASFRERRPDVVIATSPQFFSAAAGWLVSVFKARPFIFEVRDLWPASIAAVGAMKSGPVFRLLEKIELFLYAKAKGVVVVTDAFRADLIRRGVSPGKIAVVRNGVDLSRYDPVKKDLARLEQLSIRDKFVVGYIGTHGLAHALDKVVDAALLLRDRGDVAFLFVGSGAARASVEERVKSLRLSNVVLLPRQPKERMRDIWGLCDVALVPLRDSAVFSQVIPSKIFECMAMGLPVILSVPEGEAAEIVRLRGCGLVVPPESPEVLVEAIESLARSPEQLRELGRAASAAAPDYSRTQAAHRYIGLLESFAAAGVD